jgi:hypothetical protein
LELPPGDAFTQNEDLSCEPREKTAVTGSGPENTALPAHRHRPLGLRPKYHELSF